MLTLTVRVGQSVQIGRDVRITVEQKAGQRVQMSFDAPRDVSVTLLPSPQPRGEAPGITGQPRPVKAL